MIIDYVDQYGKIATTKIINYNDPLAFASAADLSGMPYLLEKFGALTMEVRKEITTTNQMEKKWGQQWS